MEPSLSDQIASLRQDYRLAELNESSAGTDPFALFTRWFEEARSARLPEPNAMTLATVDAQGQPSARVVLLKGVDAQGFSFFTNCDSRKGQELAGDGRCALVFLWLELERQVRIEGLATRVPDAVADAYFSKRPPSSRLGAVASPQSEVVTSRDWLQARFDSAHEQYGDDPPRPAHWGGYCVAPHTIEFWQGRSSRLHDRLRYRRSAADSAWQRDRLAP